MVKYYITNSVVPTLLQATIQVSFLLLGMNLGLATSVYAQTPSLSTNDRGGRIISQENVLFVNPTSGDDNNNGREATPLRTITRALQVAQPNTVIVLGRGTYSSASGEEFPLLIKSGISIQGDTAGKGRGILIQGGGEYLSRSFGRQNTTLVVGNNVTVAGVTITNPQGRGYGMWIESTNPQIVGNTFTGSVQDGIAVTGNATAKISQNYFYRNGANGVTVSGSARPEISENIFQQTGFGINIAQNAEPVITGNHIQYNRAGVIVQANARPVLRQNLIQGNREDGLVAIAQANPDLGSDGEPGNNDFRNNARYDINANAAKQPILSVGNRIDQKKIAGQVNFRGFATPIAANPILPAPSPPSSRLSLNRPSRPSRLASTVQTNTSNTNTDNANTTITNPVISYREAPVREIVFAAPDTPTPTTPSIIPPNRPLRQQQVSSATGFPIPPSLTNTNSQTTYNYLQFNPTTEINPPQPPGIQPPMPTGNLGAVASNMPMGTLYRVIVPIRTNQEEEIIRYLAPGAFRTAWQGQSVIQVGVFSSTFNAEQMVRTLNSNGLQAMIQQLR